MLLKGQRNGTRRNHPDWLGAVHREISRSFRAAKITGQTKGWGLRMSLAAVSTGRGGLGMVMQHRRQKIY